MYQISKARGVTLSHPDLPYDRTANARPQDSLSPVGSQSRMLNMCFLDVVGLEEREEVKERLSMRLCMAMLDTQVGMLEMIKLWKVWQEI